MNAREKDYLTAMLDAIRGLQSEWTEIYQWTYQVKVHDIKTLHLNDYEVTITTGSEDESCRLYLLLNEVTNLSVTMYTNPSNLKCR